jgi:murein DD-endopeptidase MepM/ murein hydrolase activator NlpD
MAEPVYDEDKNKDPNSLNPGELHELEDAYGTPEDESEDHAIERGADPNSLPRKGMGRQLRKHHEDKDDKEREALNQKLGDTWQQAKNTDARRHENQVGSGYKKSSSGGDEKSFLKGLYNRRKLLGFAGIATGGIVGIVIVFFGFLNVFKLDDMMSNIDAKTFSRFNAAADRRSDKWVQSYLFLRLMQLRGESGADPDSEYFRASSVDTNNPIRDWYHTLRTSDFESDLAKKGVVFANREAGNNIQFSVLEVDGKEVAGLSAGDVRNGNLVDKLRTNPNFVQNKLAEVDLTKPGGSREARLQIKNIVNDNVHFLQVIKRRQVRKDIQNLTGVRDWRFFETTRDKANNKKINIRNKIITKAIPESTLSGKFIRCLFGITSCRFSDDPSDPQYESDTSLAGDANPDNPGDPANDSNGKPVGAVDLGPATDVVKQVISHANLALSSLNIVSTLDTLSHVDHAIHNHSISKGVSVARGVQSEGLYQVFETSRDQMKSGQLTSDEVNKLMQVVGPVAAGDGWTKVVDGKADPSKLTDTTESRKYCSPTNQASIENNPALGNKQFAYLCADKQIGGPGTATRLEKDYNSSIGAVLDPILTKYDSVRHAPVIGTFVDFLNGIVNAITGVISGLVQDVLKAVGLDDNLQNAIGWIVGKVSAFLGAGPILNGNEAGGVIMNWLVQGGAFTAESVARANGAMATTAATRVAAVNTTNQYTALQYSQRSVFDRYLSLSNPESAAARSAFALSEVNGTALSNKLTHLGGIFKTIGSAFTLPFTRHSLAQGDSGYSGAEFAAIQTQDFPQQCYDRQPLLQSPQDGTNIQDILGKSKVPDSDLSWDLVDNSSDWYKYVYDKIGDRSDADTVAEKIYNCNLLDTSVRGGIAYVYGYTNDNGLDDSDSDSTGADDSADVPAGSVNGLVNPLQKISNLQKGRVDQGVDYSGSGPVLAMGSGKVLSTTNSGWPGGTFIVIKLDKYPDKYVYVAENCQDIKVHYSQHVNAGDELCTLVNAFPNLEIGWADGTRIGEAIAHDVWVGNDDPAYFTAYGKNFSQLLQKLGAPPGTIQAGARELGKLPEDWPTW